MYIWELPDWPRFRWNSDALLAPLADATFKQGGLLARVKQLGFDLQLEAELQARTEEVIKTSAIEGVQLNAESVRSSVARRLGIEQAGLPPADRSVDGIVLVTLNATQQYDQPLTADRLKAWQAALFPTGRSGLEKIVAGEWRDGDIDVVSGPEGRRRIHFSGPPAGQLDSLMAEFLNGFNSDARLPGLLFSGIAHLWFVTIHPFQDGNGRIARAISDAVLARTERSPARFYSVSSQIERDKRAYYDVLEHTQRGDLGITDWLTWYLSCYSRAIEFAQTQIAGVLQRGEFWQHYPSFDFNERQRRVLTRFLDNFQGHMTAKKYAALAKTSLPTAQRDLKELVDAGLLIRNEGGSKNTSYHLADPNDPGSADALAADLGPNP